MAREEPTTSLWLVPAEPDRAELRAHIDELALQQGTPTFEPHVTLVSGVVDHATVLAAVERIAADRAPLDVVAGATSHGPERFRAVVVELDDARLHDLAAALAGELGIPFDADELRPHVSLLYASGLAHGVRAAIAAEHDVAGRTFRFDTLAASVPGTEIDDVSRWQLPVVRPLTGASEGAGSRSADDASA
jgi:2'-5' RNA ligase